MTASRREYGEIGPASRWRARRRTRVAWILACVAPGLLVQTLESRGAALGGAWRVEIGQRYEVKVVASVKCHDSSCSSSGGAHNVSSEDLNGAIVFLEILPETGAPVDYLPPLPLELGRDFVPPISGQISLDPDIQKRAKLTIQERGQSKCNNIEVTGMSVESVKLREN